MSVKNLNVNKKLLYALCGGTALVSSLTGCSTGSKVPSQPQKVFDKGEHILIDYSFRRNQSPRIPCHEGYEIVGSLKTYLIYANTEPVLCDYSDYYDDYATFCTPVRVLEDRENFKIR